MVANRTNRAIDKWVALVRFKENNETNARGRGRGRGGVTLLAVMKKFHGIIEVTPKR